MKIVVLVTEVPDTYGERTLSLETGLTDRANSESVADEISERALEVALTYANGAEGVEVQVLSMAPAGATSTIRKCLAMGADSATHIVDDGLAGADLGLTAEVIAAALQKEDFDLVIAGNQSTDGMGGVLPAMLAERLGIPCATNLNAVQVDADQVSGTRLSDEVTQRVSAQLPAIISVTEALPYARFPNFKGIMAAKKKPIKEFTLADLGIDTEDMSTSRAIMLGLSERPPRASGVKITDDGEAAAKLASFLIEQRLV